MIEWNSTRPASVRRPRFVREADPGDRVPGAGRPGRRRPI